MDIEQILSCFEQVEDSGDTFDFDNLDISVDPIWNEYNPSEFSDIVNDTPDFIDNDGTVTENLINSSENESLGAYTRPNIFGGQDIVNDDGSVTTGMPNIFGGMNFNHPNGTMTSATPNIFGGFNFTGSSIESNDVWGDITHDIEEFFHDLFYDDLNEFTVCDPDTLIDGEVDPIHGGIVFGNVAADSALVDQQSGETCALMAQEQIIEKYYGIDIPEGEMAAFAQEYGVFDPQNGTQRLGWNLFLDKFKIPHTRQYDCNIQDLADSIKNGNDVFLPVDMSDYSGNLSFPPGSGHAIVVTGGAMDPQTGEITGFYINDSNHAGTPVFKSLDQMKHCMWGEMISVPDPTLI